MFASTLDTRKDSLSNGDEVPMLSVPMLSVAIPDEGRQFLNTDKDGIRPVEDILDDLRQHYGRPEVVVPLLLAQVLPVATFSDTEECLRKLKETVLN